MSCSGIRVWVQQWQQTDEAAHGRPRHPLPGRSHTGQTG